MTRSEAIKEARIAVCKEREQGFNSDYNDYRIIRVKVNSPSSYIVISLGQIETITFD